MSQRYPFSLKEMAAIFEGEAPVCVLQYNSLEYEPIPRIVRMAAGTILKLGVSDLDEEALCAQYALDKLATPVPRILHPPQKLSFRDPSELNECNLYPIYYAMEELPGSSLDKVIDNLSMDEKSSVASQLRQLLDEMSNLRSSALGSVSGGPYRTFPAVPERLLPDKPFSSLNEFRDYCRALLFESQIPTAHIDLIMTTLPSDSDIHFIHGDLLPKNIMVEGSKITGIIDWSHSGFYPAFWEYARMHDPNFMSHGWLDILRMVFPGEHLLLDEGAALSYMLNSYARVLY